jgi:hypothetical protein
MNMAVFWVVAPCSLVEVYWRCRGSVNFCQTTRCKNPEDRHLHRISLLSRTKLERKCSENSSKTLSQTFRSSFVTSKDYAGSEQSAPIMSILMICNRARPLFNSVLAFDSWNGWFIDWLIMLILLQNTCALSLLMISDRQYRFCISKKRDVHGVWKRFMVKVLNLFSFFCDSFIFFCPKFRSLYL